MTAEVESICVIPGPNGHDDVWLAVKRTINGQEVRYIECINEDEFTSPLSGETPAGLAAEVESICVIPGIYGHDEVWMSVKRTINGNTVRYIELMYEDEYQAVSAINFDCYESGYEFEIDEASTPDTIVEGESITLYITGGIPPFTFSTGSKGYTFPNGEQSYTTEYRTVQLDCVTGTCGVDYDVTCAFTVSDCCLELASSKIRNTSGHWGNYQLECQYNTQGYVAHNIIGDRRYSVSYYPGSPTRACSTNPAYGNTECVNPEDCPLSTDYNHYDCDRYYHIKVYRDAFLSVFPNSGGLRTRSQFIENWPDYQICGKTHFYENQTLDVWFNKIGYSTWIC